MTITITAVAQFGSEFYTAAFLGAALAGLFRFYGFEACGDVAEEAADPARRIPRAMILTIFVGGVSWLFAFDGYVMAAPNLAVIVSGKDADPIPGILQASLARVCPHTTVPTNALIVACSIPVIPCLIIFVGPDGLPHPDHLVCRIRYLCGLSGCGSRVTAPADQGLASGRPIQPRQGRVRGERRRARIRDPHHGASPRAWQIRSVPE